MKRNDRRGLSFLLALCLLLSLFPDWLPAAAATETPHLFADGIVFDNNACPWGSGMTKTSFTLNIRTTSDPTGNTYQWQYSADGKTAWTDVVGETAAQFHVTAPVDGMWYRCVVASGGQTAESKAVEAVRLSTSGDVHGRIWTNTQSSMAGRWFLSNGKMAYTCNLHAGVMVNEFLGLSLGDGGKFHVFGEYVNPENGKTYMLQTSYGIGGWQIYSSKDTNPEPIKFGMFWEDNYHLDECQFMFRDEYPYKVYIGPNMEDGYHSLCIWTDSQLGSKETLGQYSDYAALQTILRKDGSPLQISLVAAESLSVATEDTASMVVNTEDIDASTNFRFYVGNRRYVKAFSHNIEPSVAQGLTTGKVVANNQTFENVVLNVEGIDSGMSLSWINRSDKETIWFSIGAGSIHDAEIVTEPEPQEPQSGLAPWKSLQAAIDAGVSKIQLVKPGGTPKSGYTAVYTNESGVIPAEADDHYLHIAAGKNITLDLNGNTIHRNLSVSTPNGNAVKVEGALTLEDSAGGGLIRGGNNYESGAYGGGVVVSDGGAFTMNGGAISGNQGYYGGGVGVEDGGAFTMNGGTISGNNATYGGGVANNGTFSFSGGAVRNNSAILGGGAFNNESGVTEMSGGEISGNAADGDGGGVANYNRFTMSGGAISGNSATNGGGIVNADMGDANAFTVTGGKISGNEAEDYGGGVMLYDGVFEVSGAPDISGNTAEQAGKGFYLSEDAVITVAGALSVTTPVGVATEATPTAAAPVLITDGLKGNGATSDFASENPLYEVQLNADGEAVLALPSPELTKAPAARALTYNGAAQELVTAGTASKGTLVYRLGEKGTYSATIPAATNAGAYTVYYKVTGENGAADTPEQSLAVTIAPKPLTDSMVTLAGASKAYNGETQTPGVAVKDGSTALSADADCTLSGHQATDAGSYTAVVTGRGNYTGTVEKSWAITPAAIAPAVTLADWVYGDDAKTPVVTGNDGNGAARIEYSADNKTYSGLAPTDAGNYVVRVQIDATKNYLAGEAEASFTIQKRPATVTASNQSVFKGGAIEQGVSRAALSGNVSGHTLSAVTLTSSSTAAPTDSGTVTPSAAKIVRGGTDVTANYDISYVSGKLTVDMPTFPVTFYADSAGLDIDQKHDVLSGSSLSGYASLTLENDALRTFAGWSLEKGVTEYYGNESKIIDWDKFTMPEAPVSVYPVWVENQLTILLDLNAADEHNQESWYDAAKFDAASPASMDAAQARQLWTKIGDTLDMSRMNAATRPGYMLDGWRTKSGMFWDASWKIDPEYCDRDANGAPVLQYAPEYRGWYYTVTLTAQWTPEPKKSSIMYDLNGGTGNIVDNATYVVNDLLPVTTEEPTPPDGKRFAGWLDKAGNLYQPGDSGIYGSEDWLSVRNGEEALWMTAYYEDIPEPDYSTITFKTGGGTKTASVTLKSGEAVTKPADPSRVGYTFAGWSPAVPGTMPDEDLTVTAQWTPKRYTITFDAGRGSAVTPITQDFGTPINAPASPVLTGYTFAGWDSELPATMPARDMTLSAVWTINSYTLTFDTDGGSELPPRTGIYGASVVLPEPPVKDGFVFDGWDKEIPATVPAVHMTVKALWTPLPGKLDVTAADYSGVYDGKPHSITVSVPGGAAVTYSDAENGTYGAANPTRRDAGEYTIYYKATADGAETAAGSAKIRIAQKDITVSGIKALNKEYDGNTEAKLDYDGVTFGGLVDGDKLSVSAKGAFADAQPGKGKTVVISALTLDGDSAKNYRLADAGQQSETTADIIAPAPELSTNIYIVKQDADGSWKPDSAAPLETSDSAAYAVTELYKDGHFHVTAYSIGAYADESGRVAVSAGQSVPLDSANGKLYLYFARDAFDLTFYADTNGNKVLKTEKVLYGAPLDTYGGLKLDNTELATFAGWSTEKGVTVYKDGKGNTATELDFNGRTMSAAPLDAYPMFITNYINVRLDLGADDAVMDAAQSLSFWEAADTGILVDMGRMNAATRPDYALDGWYTKDGARWDSAYAISKEYCDRDADGNVTVGYDEPYRNHIYTLTLTAKWKLDLSATVEYDLNGGTGDITDTTAYPFNSFVTVSGTAPTPPQSQIFAGWLDSAGTLHNPGSGFAFANKALRTVKDGRNVIALTAQYVMPKDVMITFDTDGGTAVAPITEDAGEAISAPAEPVKLGYTFTGWDKPFPAVMPASNMTLKAGWKVNAYTLTFDTGRGTPIAPLTLDYGAAVNVANPSLTGYDFAGWEPGLPETMPPQNLTLKAKWTPRSYTITFDTDGGSTVQPVTDIYGAWISAPDAPVKDGYVFQDWKPELPATIPAENITVKAIWKQSEHTITFDTDDGTEITPIRGVPGSPVTAPANPTKPGYVFQGWTPALPATIPAESITVKAIWKQAEHTITFDTDGGTEITPISGVPGSPVTAPANPTKPGYVFQGWTPALPATIPAESITVKAIWKLAENTIVFDTDGGTKITPISGVPGSPVTAPANPTKPGYVFQGWTPALPATIPAESITVKAIWKLAENTIAFDTDGGTEITPISGVPGSPVTAPANPTKPGYVFAGWTPALPATIPAESITVKAIWKQSEHTIAFDTDGGTEITPISGVPGSPVTAPANPTKPGYVFQGWTPALPATIPAESITVKAIWKQAEHTITFDTDGGTEITPIRGVPGSPVTVPANPTKPGYVFAGWTPALPATIPAESITVKAIWKLAENTIAFDTDGGTEITPIRGVPGSPVTVPANPTKDGYVFQGWTPALPATIPAESITVKAIWKQSEHTITFDTDGGTEITPIRGVPGSPVTVPANPTKPGYVFAGWDMEIPASMPAEDITITAQWVPLASTLDVKSRSWDGSYDGQSHSITVTAPEGAAVTYSESRDGTYSANNPAYRDAGQYRVYYRVSKDGTESVNGSSTVHISRKEVTVSGIAARNKPYDGNTSATLYYDGVTFAGLLPGDALTVTADGAFTDAAPGDGKTVLISGLTLGGSSAGNYRLADAGQQSATTANITAQASGARVYAVCQNADGSWDNSPTLLEELVFGASSYRTAERYAAEGFRMVSYSLGAYADESRRTAASAGENVPLSGDNQDLYLYYARQTFELVFYSDSDGKTVAKTYRVPYGAALSGYAGETLPERQDYTFAGWASAPNQTSYANKNGVVNETVIDWDAETMPAETKHIYPVWVRDRLNIRLDLGGFDANNGNEWYKADAYDASTPASMDAEQFRDFDVDIGELIRMGAMNAATRVGYELDGWYTQDGVKWNAEWGLDPEYCTKEADGSYSKYENETRRYSVYAVILTARWKPVEVGVAYDTNGGSGTVTDGASYKLGDTLAIAAAPTPPDGKTFVGWKDNNNVLHSPGENLLFTDWSLVGNVSGADAILLTADYIDTPKNDASKHVITFDTDGGTAVAPLVLDVGAAVNPPQAPTKTGHTFAGWSPELPGTMPDADLTVKALWNADKYTITFVTHSATEIAPITDAYGAAVAAPAAPSRENYDFRGWTPELPATMPAKNLTLEAVWEPKTYTITFDTNGGSAIDPFSGIYGARVTVPENPVRAGHTFNGWNPEIPHYMPSANLTVTARWLSGTPSTGSGGTPSTGSGGTPSTPSTPSTGSGGTPSTPSTPSTGGGGGGGSSGGGGTPRTYKVTVVKVSGGKAKASPTRAADGVKITVTVSPDKDHALESMTVKANSGADVAVTQGASGSYTFVMPKSDVTVTPDFVKPSSQDAETDGGTPGIPVTPDGSIVPDDTPGDTDGSSATDDNGEPVPVPPDKTGVSDWLMTDAHPSYINGFTDGTFRPNASITRAQTAMMFYRLLKNKNVPRTVAYRDMSGKEWYADAVYALSYYGIIQGYSDGDFHGDRTITRAAFTAIAARFAKHIGEYKDGALRFSDVPETHWARDVITGAASCGWIAGYDDGTFRPANSITRAAATAIINRMLARNADKAYVMEHFGSLKPFSDVRDEKAWYFYNVMEAANNHDFALQGNREVWNSVKN